MVITYLPQHSATTAAPPPSSPSPHTCGPHLMASCEARNCLYLHWQFPPSPGFQFSCWQADFPVLLTSTP